jgi:hypothetical protein
LIEPGCHQHGGGGGAVLDLGSSFIQDSKVGAECVHRATMPGLESALVGVAFPAKYVQKSPCGYSTLRSASKISKDDMKIIAETANECGRFTFQIQHFAGKNCTEYSDALSYFLGVRDWCQRPRQTFSLSGCRLSL